MLDKLDLIYAIIAFVIIIGSLYLYLAPTECKNDLNIINPPDCGKMSKEKFDSFVLYASIVAIGIILFLFYIKNMNDKGAYIISPYQALDELTPTEKAMLYMKEINEMEIPMIISKNQGKRAFIKYKLEGGMNRGDYAWISLNCMSDFRYSATDIPRQTRFEAVRMDSPSAVTALENMVYAQQNNIGKIMTGINELKKLRGKGGDIIDDLTQSLVDREEKRYEG